MPFKGSNKYVMTGDDLIFHPMDIPTTGLYFSDVDVPSSAIAINTCGTQHWDVSEIFPDLNLIEKLLSSSPNTFVNSEYSPSAALSSSPGSAGACHTSSNAVPDNVRLRNHDCMWSGRCNQQESHQKMKLKAAAAAAAAAQQQTTTSTPTTTNPKMSHSPKLMTPAQSPTKVRTIQAGESLLRQKQPSKCSSSSSSSSSSGDENNNRPDTPQSLGGGEDQDITCTITGSNHLPLLGMSSKDATKEHEMNKIKEYLSDPAKQQYKAYDNSTTLADVINTLESGEFNKRDGGNGGQGSAGYHPMSPAEESDCSSRSVSRHVVDDDTESEHEMDDELSLHDDDEGISLKMMPTSHLSSSRLAGYETGSSTSRMSNGGVGSLDESEEEDDDDEEDDDEEDEEDEEDVKPEITQTGMYHHGGMYEEEEDSGTERSLYGTRLTVQEKNLIKQQTSMHSDHCYTRVKSRVDIKNLGVDTPSDSESEIDVVGVGEKNLPTNPSAKDRKALQATVRNRFVRSSSGIVTAPPTVPNSGATTPGGRYYTNNSSGFGSVSPTTTSSKKMTQKQRQFAKLDDFYGDHPMMAEANSNSSLSSSGRKLGGSQAMRNSKSSAAGRKRPASSSVGSMGYSKSSKHYHDSKKSKYSGSAGKGGSRPMQKGYANDYRTNSLTTFTLEKRNLHNDLERQRRVGLKNLFEELKCQIPSLRDKERAPKVSILREAAQLCTDLSREQETLFGLRKQRERLLQTARMLKTQLQRSAARSK